MKYAIILGCSPLSPASRRALRFAQALLDAQHEIIQLFFYQHAVHLAAVSAVSPRDELDICAEWQEFIQQHALETTVCIAAALKRGVLDEAEAKRHERLAAVLNPSFNLAGLGQLHEATQKAERVIFFGDTP